MTIIYDNQWWIGIPGVLSVSLVVLAIAAILTLWFRHNHREHPILTLLVIILGGTATVFVLGALVFHISEDKSTLYSNPRIEYGYDHLVEQLEEGYRAEIKSIESSNRPFVSDPAFHVTRGHKVDVRWVREGQEMLCEVIPQSPVDWETFTQKVDVFCNDVLVPPR